MNDFWNKAGNGRFNYYFRCIPDLQVIYDCSSRQLEKIYQKSAGFPNHDVLLIIDSILDFDDEESAKGWYCGGGADDLNMVICRSRSKTEHEDLFGIDYFHRGVAHEFGHYRGVTDLYADRISISLILLIFFYSFVFMYHSSCYNIFKNHYNSAPDSSYNQSHRQIQTSET